MIPYHPKCQRLSETDRVLYVSKGPTADCAAEHLQFGGIATMNDSACLVEGNVDYAFQADLEATLASRPAWPRIQRFFVPDFFHVNSAKSPVEASWIPGFPIERAETFPIEPICYTDEETRRAVLKDGLALCNSFCAGLHILALLGYRQIWVFGCDGGTAYASKWTGGSGERDFSPIRARAELIARCLRDRWQTDVRFFPEEFQMR